MKRIYLSLGAFALACSGPTVVAQTVFKCVDTTGRITFTVKANCPSNFALDEIVSAHNPTISREGQETVMAQPKARLTTNGAHQPSAIPPATSGSTNRQTGCSTGLDDQALRKAKVQGVVQPGMTRAQVESIYGNATDKRSSGSGSATYWSDHFKQAMSVSFDRSGCVNSTHASGYKP